MNQSKKFELFGKIRKRIVHGLAPEAVYIFGSFARGEETDRSDIDILIEKKTDQDLIKRQASARAFLKGLKHPFDILVFTPEEIKKGKKDRYSIIFRAISEGKKIYEKK